MALKKEYGIVYILDALGASAYSDEKIEQFLNARKDINQVLEMMAKPIVSKKKKTNLVSTYTFGDTLIVVIAIEDRVESWEMIQLSIFMMQNYLFHSLERGILYRGAFSIGNYIADAESNTVMGEAVTDAAAWYEKSEWMGLISTPRTNNILEHEFHEEQDDSFLKKPLFVALYPVPMKDNRTIDLYTISWAGRFFHGQTDYQNKYDNPRLYFLKLLKEHPVPFGTEQKITNTKKYFSYIEEKIASNKSE